MQERNKLGGGAKSGLLGKIQLIHSFEDIVKVENLLAAWKEFSRGKRRKKDVQLFELNLMDNIFALRQDLLNHTYIHGGYQAFKINDPKPRDIHKASVRDRLLHHAIYRILYLFFDKTFIADSYSCRTNKGTHKAISRFLEFAYKTSKNNTRTCWILKCDIRKFFANIDHAILIESLEEYISDENIVWLLKSVIVSFNSHPLSISPSGRGRRTGGVGLPLGNLTSQLFVNVYMNKFDQFAKHKLKAKYYIRYADDFVFFSENNKYLENMIPEISRFLETELKLSLHPNKVSIQTLNSGVDFLGMVNFFDHRILRTKTKRRMLNKLRGNRFLLEEGLISKEYFNASLQSYLGMLKHCEGWRVAHSCLVRFFGI